MLVFLECLAGFLVDHTAVDWGEMFCSLRALEAGRGGEVISPYSDNRIKGSDVVVHGGDFPGL